MTRKAVLKVGKYRVAEGPTGGWRIFYADETDPISVHADQSSAVATAKRYVAADRAGLALN